MTELNIGALTGSTSYTGSVDTTNIFDLYKFNINSPGSFQFSIDGLSENADVFLLNSSGATLYSSTNAGTSAETISADSLVAGDYTLKVLPISGDIKYTLNLVPTSTQKSSDADTLTGAKSDSPLPSNSTETSEKPTANKDVITGDPVDKKTVTAETTTTTDKPVTTDSEMTLTSEPEKPVATSESATETSTTTDKPVTTDSEITLTSEPEKPVATTESAAETTTTTDKPVTTDSEITLTSEPEKPVATSESAAETTTTTDKPVTTDSEITLTSEPEKPVATTESAAETSITTDKPVTTDSETTLTSEPEKPVATTESAAETSTTTDKPVTDSETTLTSEAEKPVATTESASEKLPSEETTSPPDKPPTDSAISTAEKPSETAATNNPNSTAAAKTDAVAGETVATEEPKTGETLVAISPDASKPGDETNTDTSNGEETEKENSTTTVATTETPKEPEPITEKKLISPFISGVFTTDQTGRVSVDYTFDGGMFQGELAIFSLDDLDKLEPGSEAFIKEVATRSLSNSVKGHVVINDATEGARFSGLLGESNANEGVYLGVKSFAVTAGGKYGVMLVPNGSVKSVYDNPTVGGDQRPLFSMAMANPVEGFHFGQIADVTGEGNTFVMEDMRLDAGSDRDYNDIIFQVRGATAKAALLDTVINPDKEWRKTELGKALIAYAKPYITPEPKPNVDAELSDLLDDLETEILNPSTSDQEPPKTPAPATTTDEDTTDAAQIETADKVDTKPTTPAVTTEEEVKDTANNPGDSTQVETTDKVDAKPTTSVTTEEEVKNTENNLGDLNQVETTDKVDAKLTTGETTTPTAGKDTVADSAEKLPVGKTPLPVATTEVKDQVTEAPATPIFPAQSNAEMEVAATTPTEKLETKPEILPGEIQVKVETKPEILPAESQSKVETKAEVLPAVVIQAEIETKREVLPAESLTKVETKPEVLPAENSAKEESKQALVTEVEKTETTKVVVVANPVESVKESQTTAAFESKETPAVVPPLAAPTMPVLGTNSAVDWQKKEIVIQTETGGVNDVAPKESLPIYPTVEKPTEDNSTAAVTQPVKEEVAPNNNDVNADWIARLESIKQRLSNLGSADVVTEDAIDRTLIARLETMTEKLREQTRSTPISDNTATLISRLEDMVVKVAPPAIEPIQPVQFEFPVVNQPLVGVIDTGFSGNNPDIDYSRIILGRDRVSNDANPLLTTGEGNEHGTHILGIIGATQNNGVGIDGVNDKAPLWVGRAIGSGQWAESLVEFVNAAVESNQPNAVVNLSLDLTQINPDGSVTTRYEFTPEERAAIEYARQHNVLLVVAAGNDGGVMSVLGQASQEFDNIITVGAAERINDEIALSKAYDRASYSSYGRGLDILAPGGTVQNPQLSTVGDGVGFISGTSVATAKVTGAISQVWAANPSLSYRQVIQIIKDTATDLKTHNWDEETGAGLLNITAAVDLAKATEPIDSPVPKPDKPLPVDPQTGVEYKPGEILVKFKPGVTNADILTVFQAQNAIAIENLFPESSSDLTDGQWKVLKFAPDTDLVQIRAALALDSNVAGIELNYKLSINATRDPMVNSLWGLNNTGQTGGRVDADIDAPEAWRIQTGSKAVTVAVIDSGGDYRHQDLAANTWRNTREIAGNGVDDDRNGFVDDVYGYDFINRDGDPMDDNGHGTHVAGTIGAVGNNNIGVVGVNHNVSLMHLKFLGSDGFGNTLDAVRAVDYATRMGAKVINASFGGGGYSQAMFDAISQANNAGVLFVGAAGNDANNNDSNPAFPASYNVPNIISVAATDHNDQLAWFSNYGRNSVDLGAPGVNILSTLPGNRYGSFQGTSMAAPHVAGAAALLLAQKPNQSPVQLKNILMESADRVAPLQGKTVTGGRLNIYGALSQIAPPANPIGRASRAPNLFIDAYNRVNGQSRGLKAQGDAYRWGNGWTQRFLDTNNNEVLLMLEDAQSQAYVVWGEILKEYKNVGGPVGANLPGRGWAYLGYPRSDEKGGTSSKGSPLALQEFAGENGKARLYYHWNNGNRVATWGSVGAYYINIGGHNHWLGAPIKREYIDGDTIFADFEGGRIAFRTSDAKTETLQPGQQPSWRQTPKWQLDIENEYQQTKGLLGNPRNNTYFNAGTTSAAPAGTTGIGKDYEWGSIHWSQKYGAVALWRDLQREYEQYSSPNGSGGWLGFPTRREYAWNGGMRTDFEGGYIFWDGQKAKAYRPGESPNNTQPPNFEMGRVSSRVGSVPLNMRSQPNTSQAPIGTLSVGTELKILRSVQGGTYNPGNGNRNDWYEIEVGGKRGYVAAYYVDKGSSNQNPGLQFSTVTSKATGKALDAGGSNNSVYPHPSPNAGNEFQQWGFEKVGDYYMIINKATGKALDAGGGNNTLPYIHPNPNTQNPFHLWNLQQVGDAYMIVNKATGKALDSGAENGNQIYMHPTPMSWNPFHLWKLNLPNGGNPGHLNPLVTRQGAQYFKDRPQFYTTGNIFAQSMYGSSLVGGRGYTEGNCTWYAHGRLLQMGKNPSALRTMSGNANQWHNQMSNGTGAFSSPQVGDIAQWTANGANHVAVVEQVHSNGTITISESHYDTNWDGGSSGTLHWVRTISASSPTRYIRVRNA
ncbi:S8 family serine peptidase [Microcoleus sp. D3_18_C4]|uniref:S8 family serine peptidase n=1 Tax=Microcoleus sp. D3_18_C4 TaxID=3055335 RepID=UPI002FD0E93E